jgi:hypothetical protein
VNGLPFAKTSAMVVFELDTKEAQHAFAEIKRILAAAKFWKVTTRIEITVLDGKIQLVGQGFVKELYALTTGSCKLVIPIHHWYEMVKMNREKILTVVVTEGEAMVGKVTVNVNTTFFESDSILRSIQLPANPRAIDYWKLAYMGYTQEELQFNAVDGKIELAKEEFTSAIRQAAIKLAAFRISHEELKTMILNRMSEKEKVEFRLI